MTNNDPPRLIEVAFPLKQTSIDSVHEKNVRHGHISTLHIWPARRPLAACRAALIATLLPDPGTPEKRRELLEKIGGKVVQKIEKKKSASGKVTERVKEETEGGILHWGNETENKETLEWFRQEIRKAYGGRAPKVLDPFAGGGAIPLEAMRLGCEVTAADINPVAWFILKCTLEYPQKLAGQKRMLPSFVLKDRGFMEAYLKTKGFKGAKLRNQLEKLGMGKNPDPHLPGVEMGEVSFEADLSWHVRAWGWWVLQKSKTDLESFYPVVDGKPTVAYLWARTVTCKNCRTTIPLLKTRWLCKKDNKRVVLTMEPNTDKPSVIFGVHKDVPKVGGNTAQKREYDKKIGSGTMSRSGAQCPCCPTIMTSEDLRLEAGAGRLNRILVAVAVEGIKGKEYRLPTSEELSAADKAEVELDQLFDLIPNGLPKEPVPKGGNRKGGGSPFTVHLYGLDSWYKLFTPRQLLSLGTFVKNIRKIKEISSERAYPTEWTEAIIAYLACVFSRTADYMANLCVWEHGAEEIKHVFMRWALPITWDFAEANPLAPIERFFIGGLNSAYRVLSSILQSLLTELEKPTTLNRSAIIGADENIDLIITDPPYYDAIPYSDIMDFFYVWLRRVLYGLSPEFDSTFRNSLAPKWNHEINDGELIDDESRHGGDPVLSTKVYEEGMYRAFLTCFNKLKDNGRLVVVFANKNPTAWESLVSSIIKAGFCVTASWPIATEMPGGLRNLNRASLSTSIWLICTKRQLTARPGWDNRVLEEMHENIATRLRDFWDAGIRGPDFVWAATGPALEAYSKHPAVKKANNPGQLMTVSEFLRHVRRIVVDFVVGRVLSQNNEVESVTGLDDITTYYLLHRHDFHMEDAPSGACILYAVSCNLSDNALVDQFDLLTRTGGQSTDEDDEEEGTEEAEEHTISEEGDDEGEAKEGKGSKVKLKFWQQRIRKGMGYDTDGRPAPLIDQIHRLMHFWKAGDVVKVDDYLDSKGLRRNQIFQQVLQALIELAQAGSEERALIESISNHVAARGAAPKKQQVEMFE